MNDVITAVESEWRDAVTRWENAVTDFNAAIQAHLAVRDLAIQANDLDNWNALEDRALMTRQAILQIQDTLASGSDWAKRTFGLSALSAMGFVPLIPVAVIVGSISAVVAITYSLYTYNQNLQAKWGYINAHPELTPAQVDNVLNTDTTGIPAVFSSISNSATWIVIAGLLLYFAPKFFNSRR